MPGRGTVGDFGTAQHTELDESWTVPLVFRSLREAPELDPSPMSTT